MAQVSTNDLKQGMKLEIDNQPFLVVSLQFVKPGKGQSFTRTKLKNLQTSRVIEKTFKSGEKLGLADVNETQMRMLYKEADAVIFMDDTSFEQVSIPLEIIKDTKQWLMEDKLYDIVFYKGIAVSIEPPIFMEMQIVKTAPGVKGDTASGRVMKPAVTESGAKIQVPIFVNEGEVIKIDTRTGEYASRVSS